MITRNDLALLNISGIDMMYAVQDDQQFELIQSGVIVGDDTLTTVKPKLLVTGDPTGIAYDKTSLSKNCTFSLYGTTIPVNTDVHIIRADTLNFNDLWSNEIACVRSDADGNWRIDDIVGWGGNCFCVIEFLPVFSSIDSMVTVQKEMTSYAEDEEPGGDSGSEDSGDTGDNDDQGGDDGGSSSNSDTTPPPYVEGAAFQYAFDASMANIAMNGIPDVSITGTCTTGADTVYVSTIDVGSLIQCDDCLGTGHFDLARRCFVCNGTGSIAAGTCHVCGGHGTFISDGTVIPSEYNEYINYARSNLYTDSYSNMLIWEYGDWIAISFLMDNFDIQSYDDATTEVIASGWFTCGYTKSTQQWTTHDYINEVSEGGNYAKHIVYGTCQVFYGDTLLYPSSFGIASSGGSCEYCDGLETKPICSFCEGSGNVVGHDCPVCENGEIATGGTCTYCSGTGSYVLSVLCPVCDGSGVDANGSTCYRCSGAGYENEKLSCEACGGNGYFVPELDLQTLINSHIATATVADDNTYSMMFDGSYTAYIIWAYGETGVVTANLTHTENPCLTGDTLITMADMSKKRIDEISVGEYVLAGDGTATKVVDLKHDCYNAYHVLYEFEDGTIIDEAHRHRFYNVEQGFWQYLGRWNIGEHAVREDGAKIALLGKQRVDERTEMWGLWTETMDYFANGLLTGETAVNQRVLSTVDINTAADMLATLDERAIIELTGLERILP